MKNSRLSSLLLAAVVVASATISTLANAAGLELKAEGFREVEVTDAAGKKSKQLQPVTGAVPGQEVVYVITYRNTGAKPAENVKVKNPVPKGLVYVPGSANAPGAQVDVSVDGGKQFGALEKLKVPGGDGKPRAATAADVTTVRWILAAPVKAGAEGKVSYRARVQ